MVRSFEEWKNVSIIPRIRGFSFIAAVAHWWKHSWFTVDYYVRATTPTPKISRQFKVSISSPHLTAIIPSGEHSDFHAGAKSQAKHL